MKNKGWVLLGGLGFLAAACGGRGVKTVGELNSSAGAGSSAGSNTSGNTAGGGGNTAGDGGNTVGGASPAPMGAVVYEGLSQVRDIAADATTLYWVEYGTEDPLGNFENDGRLLARDFDSEEVRLLADDLPGAVDIAVTSTHAYVQVDRYLEGGAPRPALVRMTLGGADYALVRLLHPDGSGRCVGCVASVGSAAYFFDDETIFRVAGEEPTPTAFLDHTPFSIAADETTLYLAEESGTWQAPLATGVASKLSPQRRRQIQASGAYVYGMDDEADSKVFLARISKDGSGSWERLPPGNVADYSASLQIVGNLFFHDLQLPEGSEGCSWSLSCWKVVAGRLDDTAAAETVLELPKDVTAWVGTAAGVFWSDGVRIRHVPPAAE